MAGDHGFFLAFMSVTPTTFLEKERETELKELPRC